MRRAQTFSPLSRPARGLTPGWWCERTVWPDPATEAGALVRARRCTRPTQTLIWLRLDLRTVLPLLDGEHGRQARRWLDWGQWEAVYRLKAGEPYAFAARTRAGARIAWTARPVLFLPRAEPHRPPGCDPDSDTTAELAAVLREVRTSSAAPPPLAGRR